MFLIRKEIKWKLPFIVLVRGNSKSDWCSCIRLQYLQAVNQISETVKANLAAVTD